MRKIFCALCLCLLFGTSAAAQTVTVTGVGSDEIAAQRDAARNAVERVVGTYVQSKTLVADYAVELDEIYTQSQGFVKKIEVLDKTSGADGWRITARVDVDTTPDGALMSRLQTVTLLDDPRLAVVVFDKEAAHLPLLASSNVDNASATRSGHDSIIENALTDRLSEMGFHHIVDAAQVAKLSDSALLASVYRGEARLVGEDTSRPIDYCLIGLCDTDSYAIKLPDRQGGYLETQLKSATARLNFKLIDYASGRILFTGESSGQGVENEGNLAANLARSEAGKSAAELLEKKLREAAERVTSGTVIRARTADLAPVDALVAALRELPGVNSVHLRSFGGGEALIDVDAAQKPHALVRSLKQRRSLAFYVSAISGSEIQLTLH